MLVIEIAAVIGSFTVLALSGVSMIRKAISFGKRVGQVTADIEPKTVYIMDQVDSAQRRSLSIVAARNHLSLRVMELRTSLAKVRVIFSAASEAWGRIAAVLGYVGL